MLHYDQKLSCPPPSPPPPSLPLSLLLSPSPLPLLSSSLPPSLSSSYRFPLSLQLLQVLAEVHTHSRHQVLSHQLSLARVVIQLVQNVLERRVIGEPARGGATGQAVIGGLVVCVSVCVCVNVCVGGGYFSPALLLLCFAFLCVPLSQTPGGEPESCYST